MRSFGSLSPPWRLQIGRPPELDPLARDASDHVRASLRIRAEGVPSMGALSRSAVVLASPIAPGAVGFERQVGHLAGLLPEPGDPQRLLLDAQEGHPLVPGQTLADDLGALGRAASSSASDISCVTFT